VFAQASRLIVRELDTGWPGIGRVGRTAAAALVLGLVLGAIRLAGGPLAVLMGVSCVAYPALLLALRAVDLDDVRLVLRRRAPA
jgi:hypothetical protein